jgi:hypothetical protein
MINKDTCVLYELFDAAWNGGMPSAGGGATWTLTSNALRPDNWTSADDAGLSIFAGLLRYEDVQGGKLAHAVRFTQTRIDSSGHIWPARYDPYQGMPTTSYPPMGARFRLKASFDISSFSPGAQIILTGLKHYGMFLADIGNDWTVEGTSDPRWNDSWGTELQTVPTSEFEVVDESSLMVDPNSGEAN